MKVLVAVKEVSDPAIPVHVFGNEKVLNRDGVPGVLNPFDEIALEAAIRLRELGVAREIVAVSVGPSAWEGSLRTALAMGVDRAVHFQEKTPLEPLTVANALVACAKQENADLILLGRQGVDHDHGATAPMVAGLLGWPQATSVSAMAFDNGSWLVEREVDGGRELLELKSPAIISVDLGLNTPRYASLPNIMKARTKTVELRQLATSEKPSWDVVSYGPPVSRPGGRRIGSVDELVDCLNQAGVLR